MTNLFMILSLLGSFGASVLILGIALVGCASVDVTTLKSAQPRAENCNIQVFASETEVTRPHETVCLIDSKTGSSIFEDRSLAGALEIIKPKACECGADAVILKNGGAGGYNLITGNGQGSATVQAIRFTTK